MEGSEFDESELFAAIERSGARTLLIGRRALVVLGMPVLTADYDLWLHIDDIEKLNTALATLGLAPSIAPGDARNRGRYVLENDEHVDVMVARSHTTKDGAVLTFDDAWSRKVKHTAARFSVWLPSLADLILTKRWSMRPKDEDDIKFITALQSKK